MGLLLLFSLLTVTLVLGEDDGSFIFTTESIEVKTNEEVHLNCGIKGEKRYCVWEHRNDIFQVEEVHEGKDPGKSKPLEAQDNQCGIVLDKVSNEDYGIWTCKIFIIGGSHVGSKNVVSKSESTKVTTVGTTKYPVTSAKIKDTATPKYGESKDEESGISGGAIVGIVILCLALVAAFVVSIMYHKKVLCFSTNSADPDQKNEYEPVNKSDTTENKT